MFQTLDPLRVFAVVVILVREHFFQLTSGSRDIERHLRKQIEVLLLFWQKIEKAHVTKLAPG
jgi:hypothetical protein